MDITKYENLPDSLTPDQTRGFLNELIAAEPPRNKDEAVALAQAMVEVADRHWHTYTLLDDTTRRDVDDWVIRNWDSSSLEKVEALIFVIANLGLVKSVEMLRHELGHEMPLSVGKEIENALREFGSTVDDPYSGMK